MLNYPSSVPEYNKLRFLTSDEIDTATTSLLCICAPEEVVRFLTGAISLLTDVNMWRQYGELEPENMVDIFNNEVIMNDCCNAIIQALDECPDLRDKIIDIVVSSDEFGDAVKSLAEDVLEGFGAPKSQAPEVDDLDYVYGGILGAQPEYEAAVQNLFVAGEAATALPDFFNNMPGFKWVSTLATDQATALIEIGNAVINLYLVQTDTIQAFNCAIFDSVCNRGSPYIVTSEDIDAGFFAIDNSPENPIALGISDLLKLFFSVDKWLQLFRVNSDEPDNDWSELCSCTGPVPFDVTYNFREASGTGEDVIWGDTWEKLEATTWAPGGVAYLSHLSNGLQECIISKDFAPGTEITAVYLTYATSTVSGGFIAREISLWRDGVEVVEDRNTGTAQTSGTYVKTYTNPSGVVIDRIDLGVSNNNPPQCSIKQVRLVGFGVKPT